MRKIEIRMSDEQIEKLDKYAAAANMDRSMFVRTMCLQHDRLVVMQDLPDIVGILTEIDGKISSAIVTTDCDPALIQETNKKLEMIVQYLMRICSQLEDMNEKGEQE
jgi:hypothetical protein